MSFKLKFNDSIRQFTVATVLSILTATGALGQVYSLETCISLALQNNLQILNDDLSAVSAKYRTAELRSSLLPRVDLQSQYQYYLNIPEQYAPASAFGGPEGTYNRMSLNMPQTLNTQMTITQPIINKEVRERIETATLLHEASLIQADMTRENIEYQVTASFYNIQVLQDNLLRLEENIINLEKTSGINEVLKENELIANNVYHRLRINIESLRNESENLELSLDKQMSFLKYLMQVDMEDSVTIEAFSYGQVLSETISGDLAMRKDLRWQFAQIGIAEQELNTITARYAPVVSATFSSGFTGYNDEFAPYRQINGDWINGSYVALNAKIPLFAGFQKKHQVSQQKISILKSSNMLMLMRAQAEKEVFDADRAYNSGKDQLVNTMNSLTLAEQLFESTRIDYENGITTMTDLLNAQNDLSNARINYSNALLHLRVSELELKKAYGLL